MKRNLNPYQCEICGQPYLIPRKNGYFLKIRGAVLGNDLKTDAGLNARIAKPNLKRPFIFGPINRLNRYS